MNAAIPGTGRFRRLVEGSPGTGCLESDRHLILRGSSGDERFHRRIHHPARRRLDRPCWHSPWFAGSATLGVILAAVYLLTMFEKVFLGPVTLKENSILKDLSVREILTLLPLIVLIFWIGLYPAPFYTLHQSHR